MSKSIPAAVTPLVLNLEEAFEIAYKYTKYLVKNKIGVIKYNGLKNESAMQPM